MSPLAARLKQMIASNGPLTVARYMELCLSDPQHGYYTTGQPIGAEGDFITAPEVSQMFGELIGLWCAVTWRQMGAPSPLRLVELGPGRGSLLADALRAARSIPEFMAAIRLHLVENSASLRTAQQSALAQETVAWHDSFDDVPQGPSLVIANEFFDALPIHQYERISDSWRERLIDLNGDDLRFVVAARPAELVAEGREGDVYELGPQRDRLAGRIARRIAAHGGAALIIDYGHRKSAPGDTLQAVRGHKRHAVLDDPGRADLTAHVDFEALGNAAKAGGARVLGPVEQGRFLSALGIEARAAALLQNAPPAQAGAVESGLLRLTTSDQMGTLFKAMAFAHPELPASAGFEGFAAMHANS